MKILKPHIFTRAFVHLFLFISLLCETFTVSAAKGDVIIMDMPGAIPLITDPSAQISSPFWGSDWESSKDRLPNLIDNNPHTYIRTDRTKTDQNHYIDIDLRGNYKGSKLAVRYQFVGDFTESGKYMSKETLNPKKLKIYTSSDSTIWKEYGGVDLNYYTSRRQFAIDYFEITPKEKTRYLRIEVTECKENNYNFNGKTCRDFGFSELQVYDVTVSGSAAALITSTDQFRSEKDSAGLSSVKYLLDCEAKNTSIFLENSAANSYLQVSLHGAVMPGSNMQLVIMRRHEGDGNVGPIPTKIRVEASTDDDTYTKIADLNIRYAGPDEYMGIYQASEVFKANAYYKYLRFYCEESVDNKGNKYSSNRFCYADFRLYLTNREDLIADFSPSDYHPEDNFKNPKYFEHTLGLLNSRNRLTQYLYNYCDWDKWTDDGVWQDSEDEAVLNKYGIYMPDYSYIEDYDVIEGDTISIDGVRQRAHTIYHQIYALPGEYKNLYSFSDARGVDWGYRENFHRWYDYRTDKESARLSFPIDGAKESQIIRFGNAGHFSGSEFGFDTYDGTIATYHVPDGSDVEEDWIALDFAQNFSLRPNRNYDEGTQTLYEPRIAFRHVFHIQDGRKFADKNMADHAGNVDYARKNRRYVTARAGADFQIRCDQPPAADKNTHSAYTYKLKDGSYDYVRAMDIVVYDSKGNPDNTVKFDSVGTYTGHEYSIGGKSYPKPSYYRGIKCLAENAKKGKYLVRLLGKDESDKRILLDNQPLIVQEYMIEFVDNDEASFSLEADVPEAHKPDYLESLYDDPIAHVDFDEYRHLIADAHELKNPENYITSTLYSEHHSRLYPDHEKGGNGYSLKIDGDFRFKWPRPWSQSNYSYMYASGFDFNMYTITNSFNLVPFNLGAREQYNSTSNETISFFDRRAIEGKYSLLPRGFMYYVNAAADPGEMVQIPIENLCPGSTLYVTGWVCEQSGSGKKDETPEMANLIVSMQRVDGSGKEQTLHSFVTGYPTAGDRGKWYQFFYSVVLNYDEFGITIDPDAKFRIILENNAISSHGADYAIDDIRVYVALPNIDANQTVPLCDGSSATTVQVEMPFKQILAVMHENEETESTDKRYKMYYTFLKKKIFKDTLETTHDYGKAFSDALLHYDYMDGNRDYGYVEFSPYFEDNTPASTNVDGDFIPGKADSIAYSYLKNGQWLTFNTDPRGDMKAGDELILAVAPYKDYPKTEDGRPFELCNVFDIQTECQIRKDIRLSSAAIVRINGAVVDDPDEITVCYNQRPVVTLDVVDKNEESLGYQQPFDWYDGPMNSKDGYVGYTACRKQDMLLHDVMDKFRQAYRDAVSLEGLSPDEKFGFTQPMIDWLKELATPDAQTNRPKLFINRTSFVFPPTKVPDGADEAVLYVTGIPINRYEGKDSIVCIEPTEVRVLVKNHAPELWHGFKGADIYPDDLDDVPVRIGLGQIEYVSVDNINVGYESANSLKLPLRYVKLVSDGAKEMQINEDDPYLYLVETDDENYFDEETSPLSLPIVGRLVEMTATEMGEDTFVKAVFDRNFSFREGCYYRLQFNYKEDHPDTETDENGNVLKVYCDGQDVVTLKIVPEYLVWTGTENRNWGNDGNWRRVSSADLLIPADMDAVDRAKFANFLSDGNNSLNRAFAPLDFTKVIIPDAGANAPLAFNPDVKTRLTYNGSQYDILADYIAYTDDDDERIASGTPGLNVNYDMAATSSDNQLMCRPWYTHKAKEIHFNANATISGQQHLAYEKAWGDFEVHPYMWQLCSSPFMETVAGDLYLPSANARQETQLFTEITFNRDDYDRFRPSVFQRSWNHAGKANIYKFDVDVPEDAYDESQIPSDVDLTKFKWSNVYNDVKESYGLGAAFAIKTDVAKVNTVPDMALFRLPKSDTEYKYYNYETDSIGDTDGTIGIRPNNHKLNPTHGTKTVRGRGESFYYMVGNPFMCRMDVRRFLKVNAEKGKDVLNQFYYVDSQGAHYVVFTDSGVVHSGPESDDPATESGFIPPFASFFVVLDKEKATDTFVYEYDESMMADEATVNAPSTYGTRSATVEPMRIELWSDGKKQSESVLLYSEDSSAEFDGREDMALICDDEIDGENAKIFTVAGKTASVINTVPFGTPVGLGVIAPDSEPLKVRFSGDMPYGLYLLDSHTKDMTAIEDGMEVELNKSTVGRYFITADVDATEIDMFDISVRAGYIRISAPGSDEMNVNVYDLLGCRVYQHTTSDDEHSFRMPSGIYVVEVVRGDKRHSVKVSS